MLFRSRREDAANPPDPWPPAKLGAMSSDAPGMLPSGTVTLLFTDVEGSTKLWAADKDAMSASLLVHDDSAGGD